MDQIAVTAASGLHSRMQALDLLANNLANSTTSGYKLDREFYSLFSAQDNELNDGDSSTTKLPVIQKQWTDFSQGVLTPTGAPLDLALSGKGFFVVNGPSGLLYTRAGGFQISPAGVMTTPEGYALRADDGQTIKTQSQSRIEVSTDGTVNQDGQSIGKIAIVDFQDKTFLDKLGNSYFKNGNPAIQPSPAADTTVEQGKVENSNVAAAESAVRLVGLMRQFEMLQKAISVTTDMNKKALEDVAKV